ncbi:hypothetical protein SAICODRAFT_18640 [Saitoella complicata NRRL Y-17804]|uniref:Pinin/SDK/MemA protein domain-containing protein n=1 Tax=Saitoella complicata (strain BCRC 22490 / CBS 7301 / JCM 7358 / NBRC 10748 / NRRL Y-17804) TaxID=698492 RepID=A0A0E9NG37_SAICN|nr:uncharacterized protein SAICODRAFT_18640 [Saitoella complicata NRRL Y-17804]ODQ53599.1 hypothetical protein SAICODRAFT_18640 [Saitoella complicata NRRL Y-17804]GAO48778.1 hypothetical protein G7K_2947-t1 [Saitoella complicata NRRL Y-17804]
MSDDRQESATPVEQSNNPEVGSTPVVPASKRRLSNDTDMQDAQSTEALKRQRTAPEESTSAQRGPPTRRRTAGADETQRGKRMFGALLGQLGRAKKEVATEAAKATTSRRSEIEAKLHEKLKKEKVEFTRRESERNAVRDARRAEQAERFADEVLERRHENMLAMARSLRTKTEPVIYYKPWQLTEDDEERIEAQIREAEEIVARERDERRAEKERRQQGDEERKGSEEKAKEEMEVDEADPADGGRDTKKTEGSDEEKDDSGSIAPAVPEHEKSDTSKPEAGMSMDVMAAENKETPKPQQAEQQDPVDANGKTAEKSGAAFESAEQADQSMEMDADSKVPSGDRNDMEDVVEY